MLVTAVVGAVEGIFIARYGESGRLTALEREMIVNPAVATLSQIPASAIRTAQTIGNPAFLAAGCLIYILRIVELERVKSIERKAQADQARIAQAQADQAQPPAAEAAPAPAAPTNVYAAPAAAYQGVSDL